MALENLRKQYEALPYPERSPADEADRLITGSPSNLWELNHYVFGGTRNWDHGFRALIAGGGTGDAAIMLAQQLTDAGIAGTVCHLDLSKTSQDIARARAEIRGLTNIEFRQGSLLEIRPDDGRFDYIDCCGVLHHLDNPSEGLAALTSLLAKDGGIGLMVYGELGRTGVYHIQDVLRTLSPLDEPVDERLSTARRLIEALPPTNWLVRNPFVSDHVSGTSAGLYDLLLHSRDRAYLVPELAELVAGTGLRITSFIEPSRYRPDFYLKDPNLVANIKMLDPTEQAALAELIAGNMNVHILYAVKTENDVALPNPGRADAIPILREMTPKDAGAAVSSGHFSGRQNGLEIRLPVPPLAKAIVERCDGSSNLSAIHNDLQTMRSDLDWTTFSRQFGQLYDALNGINHLLLRLPTQ